MILADKIIDLRKKAGLSQEELAEQLGVSRQAVSKWESAQSTPDLDRIIKLSQLFGVSTDYLVKDEFEAPSAETVISAELPEDSAPALRRVSMEEANRFLAANEKRSLRTAFGVALCILSPVPAILVGGTVLSGHTQDLLSAVPLFLLIAGAVALFIISGMTMKPYEYMEKEGIDTEYGVSGMVKDKKEKFAPVHIRNIVIGVVMLVLSVMPPIVCDALDMDYLENAIAPALMFALVAVGVFIIVRSSIKVGGYRRLLEEDSFTREKKGSRSDKSSTSTAMSVYWSLITAAYLGYSFITFDWGRSWIIWPIAAVLCEPVAMLARAVTRKS
ncbi:MAG: helix-turn-helix transcriptional regulator [Ruminococcus sp.]|nr:helix-turn-helix transcriptional regulator [Ruminococcus sp.]